MRSISIESVDSSNHSILAARSAKAKAQIVSASARARSEFRYRIREVFNDATDYERVVVMAAKARGSYREAHAYLALDHDDLGPVLLHIEDMKYREVEGLVDRGFWRHADQMLKIAPLCKSGFNPTQLLITSLLDKRVMGAVHFARRNEWTAVMDLLSPLTQPTMIEAIGDVLDEVKYEMAMEAAANKLWDDVDSILDEASPGAYRLIVGDLETVEGFQRPTADVAQDERFKKLVQTSSPNIRRMLMSLGPDALAVIDEAIATAPNDSSGFSEAVVAIKAMQSPYAKFTSAELAKALLETRTASSDLDLT